MIISVWKKTCRAQQKISEISEIRGLLKIIVVYKEVEAYEEQGILEDGDSDHRDGADGTGNYAGRERLREPLREEKKEELSVFSFFFSPFPCNIFVFYIHINRK